MERPVTNIRPGVEMVLRTMLTPCVFGPEERAELARCQDQLKALKEVDPRKFYKIERIKEKVALVIPKLELRIRELQEEASGFPRINMKFLGWNNPIDCLGYFGVGDVNGDDTEFSVQFHPRWGINEPNIKPGLPLEWVHALKPTVRTLARLSKNEYDGRSVKISSTFSPNFPPDIRQNIERAEKSGIFDGGIYVIYQVPEWQIELGEPQVIPTDEDPFIVGHSNTTGVSRFIPPSFYPTRLEMAILGC